MSATYRVDARRTGNRQAWETQAQGLTSLAAKCEVEKAFYLAFANADQAVVVNEQTGKVVGRYEKTYNDRRKVWRVTRVGTR